MGIRATREPLYCPIMDQTGGRKGSSAKNKNIKNKGKNRCQAPKPLIFLNTNHFAVAFKTTPILYT